MNLSRAPMVFASLCTLLLAACGGSSDDAVALCKQGCTKQLSLCYADAGAEAATFQSFCESSCTSSAVSQTKTCSNSGAIIAAYKGCLAKTTCDELTSCESDLPDCAGGGTGGSSGGGTGGSSGGGTGGMSGGGTGGFPGFDAGISGTCADLLRCCNAATAQLKPACTQAYTEVLPSGDLACAIVFSGIRSTYCPTI